MLLLLAEDIRPECNQLTKAIERRGASLQSSTAFRLLRDARLRELRNSIPTRWEIVSDGLPAKWRSGDGFEAYIWPLLGPRHDLQQLASLFAREGNQAGTRLATEEVGLLLEALEPAERACSLIESGLDERVSEARRQAQEALEREAPLPEVGTAIQRVCEVWGAVERRLQGLPKAQQAEAQPEPQGSAAEIRPTETLVLIELIGSGAHAEVWLAKDELRDQLAVKVLKPAAEGIVGFELVKQGRALTRTERNATPHENIVSALYTAYVQHPESGQVLPALVMPYVAGKPLETWFKEARLFEREEAQTIGRSLIAAISHMHNECGLAHNDLHGENVMVGEVTKVIDIFYCGDSLAVRSTAGRVSRLHRDRNDLVLPLKRLLENSGVASITAGRFAVEAFSQSDLEGISVAFESCFGGLSAAQQEGLPHSMEKSLHAPASESCPRCDATRSEAFDRLLTLELGRSNSEIAAEYQTRANEIRESNLSNKASGKSELRLAANKRRLAARVEISADLAGKLCRRHQAALQDEAKAQLREASQAARAVDIERLSEDMKRAGLRLPPSAEGSSRSKYNSALRSAELDLERRFLRFRVHESRTDQLILSGGRREAPQSDPSSDALDVLSELVKEGSQGLAFHITHEEGGGSYFVPGVSPDPEWAKDVPTYARTRDALESLVRGGLALRRSDGFELTGAGWARGQGLASERRLYWEQE